jgi:A/G-specific adenine glycosylase
LNRYVRASARLASQIVQWFIKNQRDLPWRRTRDPYAIWVSEIMLQQTQVKTVIPYWDRWMRELPTVRALAEAAPERVLKLWEGLGYYSRARNLQKAAQLLMAERGGVFPEELDQILRLPGVGRYTAGAIASIAFGQAAPILDGNVIRVLARFFGIEGDPKQRVVNEVFWKTAESLVESVEDCSSLNQGLMELGATVCLPRQPRCEICPVRERCLAREENRIDLLPELPAKEKATARFFEASLVRENGRILLRQRPKGVVNSGFWELPNTEIKRIRKGALCTIRHTITRFRMTLQVVEAEVGKLEGKWFNLATVSEFPLVSAHRKALVKLGLIPASTA